ncbi:MAG: hypothetical protein HeimC2_19170 [Candidatus Heimdallarchaeota archaeon LC_2]|nr:MAG: hypothetical protein HeimC2_19170 [Candidatus Heimdallarchaeota archaeon LC_2]
MPKSTKRLISQRWDEEFSEKMKKIASKLNVTTTDLTIESLEFIANLVENKPKLMKDPRTRKELLQYILDFDFSRKLVSETQMKNMGSKNIRGPHKGYIIDRITLYLIENEGQSFSSTQLAKILEIPQPTVRTYIRKLVLVNSKFIIIKGRPNFISYNSKKE